MTNLKNYMKTGIILSMAFPSSSNNPDEYVKALNFVAKDDFFDIVEIGQIREAEVRYKVKQIIETSKLTVSYSGHSRLLANGLNINDLNEVGRLKAVEILKEEIDEARELNAVSFSFLSGHYQERSKEEAFQALLKSVREICRYADKNGLSALLEVFDYNIAKKSLIGPVALVERLTRETQPDCPNFGIMVDLSHLPMLGESPRQAILPIAKYLRHAHIGNTVVRDPGLEAYGDEHPRFGFPGSANDVEEVKEFLQVLLEIGYLNTNKPPVVSFEIKPRSYEDSRLIIAGAKRVLKEAWAQIG